MSEAPTKSRGKKAHTPYLPPTVFSATKSRPGGLPTIEENPTFLNRFRKFAANVRHNKPPPQDPKGFIYDILRKLRRKVDSLSTGRKNAVNTNRQSSIRQAIADYVKTTANPDTNIRTMITEPLGSDVLENKYRLQIGYSYHAFGHFRDILVKYLKDNFCNEACIMPGSTTMQANVKLSDVDVAISSVEYTAAAEATPKTVTGYNFMESFKKFKAINSFIEKGWGPDPAKLQILYRDIFDLNFYLSDFVIIKKGHRTFDTLSDIYLSTDYPTQFEYAFLTFKLPGVPKSATQKLAETATINYLDVENYRRIVAEIQASYEKIKDIRDRVSDKQDEVNEKSESNKQFSINKELRINKKQITIDKSSLSLAKQRTINDQENIDELVNKLSELSTYEDESYHTQGSFIHVVQIIQIRKKAPSHSVTRKRSSTDFAQLIKLLEVSMIENLCFAYNHFDDENKRAKYLFRVVDAIRRISAESELGDAENPLIELINNLINSELEAGSVSVQIDAPYIAFDKVNASDSLRPIQSNNLYTVLSSKSVFADLLKLLQDSKDQYETRVYVSPVATPVAAEHDGGAGVSAGMRRLMKDGAGVKKFVSGRERAIYIDSRRRQYVKIKGAFRSVRAHAKRTGAC